MVWTRKNGNPAGRYKHLWQPDIKIDRNPLKKDLMAKRLFSNNVS
jgi:hypothetical protein